MDEILSLVAQGAVTLLATVVTGLVAWGSRSLKHWLDSKAHLSAFSCATAKLEHLISDAVDEVEQTLVRQLKSQKQWGPDTARMARDTALRIAKQNLGPKGLKELQGCLGLALADVTGLMRTKIESRVGKTGKGDGPIVPVSR